MQCRHICFRDLQIICCRVFFSCFQRYFPLLDVANSIFSATDFIFHCLTCSSLLLGHARAFLNPKTHRLEFVHFHFDLICSHLSSLNVFSLVFTLRFTLQYHGLPHRLQFINGVISFGLCCLKYLLLLLLRFGAVTFERFLKQRYELNHLSFLGFLQPSRLLEIPNALLDFVLAPRNGSYRAQIRS